MPSNSDKPDKDFVLAAGAHQGSLVLRGEVADVLGKDLLELLKGGGLKEGEGQQKLTEALDAAARFHQASKALAERRRAIAPRINPAPSEVLEVIQNGAKWMGFGCDRRFRSNILRARDLELWIKHLHEMGEKEGEFPIILIADSGLVYNIYAELWRKEENWKEGNNNAKTNEELMEESRKMARIIGVREKAYIEAIQDTEFSPSARTTVCNPVYLMSEVLEDQVEFDRIFCYLQALVDQDEEFAEKVWNCVPSKIKRTVGGGAQDKNFAEIISTPQSPRKEKARHLMMYPLYEAAMIIAARGGIKLGNTPHSEPSAAEEVNLGEGSYDDLAQYILGKYGTDLGVDDVSSLRNEYPKVKLIRGSVPYRSYALSLMGANMNLDVRAFIQGDCSWQEVEESMRDLEVTWKIYQAFLNKIATSEHLDENEKKELKHSEILRIFAEIVIQLKFIPEIEYLFRITGVLDVLENLLKKEDPSQNLSQLDKGIDSSFVCKREKDESVEAYIVRFVYCLLSGEDGPSVTLSGGSEVERMHEFLCQVILQLYGELTEGKSLEISFKHDNRHLEVYRAQLIDSFINGQRDWEEVEKVLQPSNQGIIVEPWREPYAAWCVRRFKVANPGEVDWRQLNRDFSASEQ